jgi:hypothetical protein
MSEPFAADLVYIFTIEILVDAHELHLVPF